MAKRKYDKRAQASAAGNPFATAVRFSILALTTIFILAILTLGGIAAYNQIQAGRGATVVEHGEVAVEETGVHFVQKYFGETFYRAIFRPQITYGFQSDIDQSQDFEAGIKNMKLQQVGRPRFGEPIEVTGTFTAASPLFDLDLVVECQLDDKETVPAELSATAASGNKARIFKKTQETVRARCVFPEGLSPEGDVEFVTGFTETESGIPLEVPGTVTMYIRYNYYSKAGYSTYMLSKKIAQDLLSKSRNPFEFFGVEDPQLSSDRTVRSKTIPGPLNLGIGSFTSQPFVEATPYDISVTLRNNPGEWRGELKKLDSLDLLIPPYFRLEGDQDYTSQLQTVVTCPFEYTGQEDSEGFRVYTLKPEELDRVNAECAKETLESAGITVKECLDIFGKDRDIGFTCNFKHSREYESIRQDFIHAEARYIYQTKKQAVVKAVRPIA